MVPECVGHCMYRHVFVFMEMAGVYMHPLSLFLRILHSAGTYVSSQDGKHIHMHARSSSHLKSNIRLAVLTVSLMLVTHSVTFT